MFLIMGWTITGLLIGAAVGIFDVLAALMKQEDLHGALKKVFNGILGGTVGGILGGLLSIVIGGAWTTIFGNKPRTRCGAPAPWASWPWACASAC